MSEKYISLENLKEYNKQMKETYIKPLETLSSEQDTKIAVLENKMIAATEDNILSIFN